MIPKGKNGQRLGSTLLQCRAILLDLINNGRYPVAAAARELGYIGNDARWNERREKLRKELDLTFPARIRRGGYEPLVPKTPRQCDLDQMASYKSPCKPRWAGKRPKVPKPQPDRTPHEQLRHEAFSRERRIGVHA